MKYIKVIIYVSLLFFVGILNVYANESYDYTFVGVNKWGNDIGNVSTALIKLEDEESNILNTYCIDYNTSTSSNHNYSLVNVGDASYIDDTTAKDLKAFTSILIVDVLNSSITVESKTPYMNTKPRTKICAII